jgi:hypothetical protein
MLLVASCAGMRSTVPASRSNCEQISFTAEQALLFYADRRTKNAKANNPLPCETDVVFKGVTIPSQIRYVGCEAMIATYSAHCLVLQVL